MGVPVASDGHRRGDHPVEVGGATDLLERDGIVGAVDPDDRLPARERRKPLGEAVRGAAARSSPARSMPATLTPRMNGVAGGKAEAAEAAASSARPTASVMAKPMSIDRRAGGRSRPGG
jgi:hypothetical protein